MQRDAAEHDSAAPSEETARERCLRSGIELGHDKGFSSFLHRDKLASPGRRTYHRVDQYRSRIFLPALPVSPAPTSMKRKEMKYTTLERLYTLGLVQVTDFASGSAKFSLWKVWW